MVVSAATLPVSADYTKAEYDVERASLDYNTDGTETNTIDSSKAKQFTTEADIFNFTGKGYLTTDFFLSYDFNLYTVDGAVPGEMIFGNTSTDIGPKMSYDSDNSKKHQGNLVTQTGKSSYDALGEITPDTWYTIEFEGRFLGTGARVDCSLYKYDNGVKTLVKKTESINLRNFSGTSNKQDICRIYAHDVNIDNVKLVSTHPDTIDITSETGEYTLDAGSSAPLSYTLTRNDKAVTNTYDVTLALYDASNTNPISDNVAYLTPDHILVTKLTAPAQTITVRATTSIEGKELTGTKQFTINGVDTSNEKFDEVTVEGPDEVEAGKTAQYTFTAKKNGADVTSTLADTDFEWSIYSTDDLNKNNNQAITLTGGKTTTLSVGANVIAQKMNIRLSTKSGLVYGSKTVNVTFAQPQPGEVLAYSACEDSVTTATRVPSIDGSSAYQTTANTYFSFPSSRSDYVLTEFDVCFANADSGIYFERGTSGTGGEKWNTSFYLKDGVIKSQTGSSSWSTLPGEGLTVTTDDWFHFEVLYKGVLNKDKNDGLVDASCIITKYNEDGTLDSENKKTFLGVTTRNGDAYGCIDASAGVIIDNVKASVAAANELTLTVENDHVYAGDTLQATATVSYNGLPIKDAAGLKWEVLDSSDKVITGDNAPIKISGEGLLTVSPTAQAQKIKIRLTSGIESRTANVEVLSRDIFEIKNIGVNEAKTRIEKLYLEKKFNYKDDVTFVFAIYRSNALVDVKTIQTFGDTIAMGETNVAVGYDLPKDFNPETDKIRVYTWTRF